MPEKHFRPFMPHLSCKPKQICSSADTRMVPQASAWAINRVAQKAVSVATRQVAGNTVAGDNQVKGIPLKTVYDVASGDALFISELGPLPENVTWLSPEGEFQKWNGTAWVKDAEAEKLFRIREAEETKNSLMQVASEHIAPLQDAVDLEIATEEETSLLEAWKKYRVLLNRVDTSTAPDIEWAEEPDTM